MVGTIRTILLAPETTLAEVVIIDEIEATMTETDPKTTRMGHGFATVATIEVETMLTRRMGGEAEGPPTFLGQTSTLRLEDATRILEVEEPRSFTSLPVGDEGLPATTLTSRQNLAAGRD